MTEDEFAGRIIDLARLRGWRVVHYRPCQTKKGWRTPLQGDRGAPDLILARRGRVLLVELKSDKGTLRPGQREWGVELGDHYRLWRPRDWDQVLRELR